MEKSLISRDIEIRAFPNDFKAFLIQSWSKSKIFINWIEFRMSKKSIKPGFPVSKITCLMKD